MEIFIADGQDGFSWAEAVILMYLWGLKPLALEKSLKCKCQAYLIVSQVLGHCKGFREEMFPHLAFYMNC